MSATRILSLARLLPILVLFMHAQPTAAITRHVPTDFSTVQAAVDASGAGDTVLVLPGTYRENILITREIWLRSSAGPAVTIIDGGSPANPDFASVVAIISPETPLISGGGIEGFDIRNGRGTHLLDGGHGGGIFIKETGAPGPLIRNNWIHDNLVQDGPADGGGLSATSYWVGVVRVIGNRFYTNAIRDPWDWRSFGAAVGVSTSSSRLEANEIFDNHNLSPGNLNSGAVSAGEAAVLRNVIDCNEGDQFSALWA